jgi:hypothetical protein
VRFLNRLFEFEFRALQQENVLTSMNTTSDLWLSSIGAWFVWNSTFSYLIHATVSSNIIVELYSCTIVVLLLHVLNWGSTCWNDVSSGCKTGDRRAWNPLRNMFQNISQTFHVNKLSMLERPTPIRRLFCNPSAIPSAKYFPCQSLVSFPWRDEVESSYNWPMMWRSADPSSTLCMTCFNDTARN